VEADTDSTTPRWMASVAGSGQLHLASGTSFLAAARRPGPLLRPPPRPRSGAVVPYVGGYTDQATLAEPAPPLTNRVVTDTQGPPDRGIGGAVGGGQYGASLS